MELSKKTLEYWKEEDWKDLENVKNVSDIYTIADRIITRMDKPFIQVCGPVANGGLGSIKANLDFFNETIKDLQNKGLSVFDQMPFEGQMQNLKKKFSIEEISDHILNDFYMPIFKSGNISAFYFIPNWQTSYGAKWEHEKAKELGVKIIYL